MEIKTFTVKTLQGLEPVLAEELRALGATGVRETLRAVLFDGDQRMLYRANYELRTALRILVPVHSFPAYKEEDLYRGIREVNWSDYMGVSDTLAVDVVARSDVFRHTQYVGQLTKDAVVDQFRDKFNRRPSVNPGAPTLRIHVWIQGTQCHVFLDSSDEPLFKRGLRRDTVEAPLNEVLAAGMILLSGWNCLGPFVDPMCGSGTLPIEAVMIAKNIPPQFKRPGFGFFKWPDFDKKLWQSVKSEADAGVRDFEFPIQGSDKDPRARNSTSLNVMSAGLENYIQIEKIPFEKVTPPETPGVLITNPPYDERLKVEDIEKFYKQIGDTLKKKWSGWNAWVISSNRDALKSIGLKTSRKITLFNGALECSFQKFELYEGTKKQANEE